MKNNKKLVGIFTASALCASALVLGVTQFNPFAVSATEVPSEFKINSGAAVRLATEEETASGEAVNGIRFSAYITKAYYNTLKETYATATAITMQSTVSKVVEEGATAPTPFEYEWDIAGLTDASFVDDVATFYHTINFNALTGDYLKAANAFEMEADFWLEVTTDGDPIVVNADNAATVDTTRSMRQVAYMAYTTPGTEEEPNEAFENESLLNYFTLSESANVAFDLADKGATVDKFAPTGITAEKVYAVDGETVKDVTGKGLVGENGAFASSEEGALKTLVYFDENNVAYPVETRFATKIIKTEEDFKYFAATTSPYTDNLTDAINEKWAGQKSRKGYWILNNDITVDGTNWSAMYNHRYFENGVFDGNGNTLNVTMGTSWSFGLFGYISNATIKNMSIVITESAGKYDNSKGNVAPVLAFDATNDAGFENVSVQLNGSVNTPVSKLCLVRDWQARANFTNVVINIADGIMAEGATTYGINSLSTNCYVFSSSALDKGDEFFTPYLSVADAVAKGEEFTALTESGMWVFENGALLWAADVEDTVNVFVNGEKVDEVEAGMQETIEVTASYFAGELTPTLTVVDGEDVVSVEGNQIVTLNKAGTAIVKVTLNVNGKTIEKTIAVSTGYAEYNGVIRLSDINDKAHLPNGLTPVRVTDTTGVVYYENGAWDWTKITASQTWEIVSKTFYVETSEKTYIVQAEIYMGVIASEEDFKYFTATGATYTANLTANVWQGNGNQPWTDVKTRKGYWIVTEDITVNGANWSSMWNHRYFENGMLDGNGHTITVDTSSWSFGVFGNVYNSLIKNLELNIIVTAEKLAGNNNKNCILACNMRDAFLVDCLINVSLSGDAVPVEKLNLTTGYDGRAGLKDCVITIADGILAENGQVTQIAGNWNVHGTLINVANVIVITNTNGVTSSSNKVTVAKSVADVASDKITAITASDWWTYDAEAQTLTFGRK